MEAINFPESNFVFTPPDDLEDCGSVNAFIGTSQYGTTIITCYELTREEIDTLIETRKLWLYHYGNGLQPHAPSVNHPFAGLQ